MRSGWSRSVILGVGLWVAMDVVAPVLWAQELPPAFPTQGVGPSAPAEGPPATAPATPAAPPRYVQVVDQADPPPSQGQVWREYDLRPHLTRVRGMENPQRAVIDWILRETGTDRWIGDTPGMVSFEGDRLRVYHVPEVQQTVESVIDRFVNPELSRFSVSVRLITIENVGWRALALPLMEPVRVETPGLQAWVMTRENACALALNYVAWSTIACTTPRTCKLAMARPMRSNAGSHAPTLNGCSSLRPITRATKSSWDNFKRDTCWN